MDEARQNTSKVSVEEGTDMVLKLFYKDKLSLNEKQPKCNLSDDELSDNETVSKLKSETFKENTFSALLEEEKKHKIEGPITIIFSVRVETNYGEEVLLCGDLQQLGEWNPSQSIKLDTNKDSYPNWSVSLTLPTRKMEYKYVILKNRDLNIYKWEDFFENRSLELNGAGIWTFVDDGVFGKRLPPYIFNDKTLSAMKFELEDQKKRIKQQIEEKQDFESNLEKFRQRICELEQEIIQLKKKISLLEGAKLESLSNSDLKNLLYKSKKTARCASVELTKRLENEIYQLQRLRDCAVCMDKPIDTVCFPCGHLALCYECATKLCSRCVICNVKTQRFQKVFLK